MNFDNPVYRKTTEEQFVLEKADGDPFASVSLQNLFWC